VGARIYASFKLDRLPCSRLKATFLIKSWIASNGCSLICEQAADRVCSVTAEIPCEVNACSCMAVNAVDLNCRVVGEVVAVVYR
jgi:hypothetical protein